MVAFGGEEGDVFFVLRDEEEVIGAEVGGGRVWRGFGGVGFVFVFGGSVSSRDDGSFRDRQGVFGGVAEPGPGWRLESDGVGSRAGGNVWRCFCCCMRLSSSSFRFFFFFFVFFFSSISGELRMPFHRTTPNNFRNRPSRLFVHRYNLFHSSFHLSRGCS